VQWACVLNASMTVGNIPTKSANAFSISRKCESQRTSHRSLWTLGFTVARVRSRLLALFSISLPTEFAPHHLASLVAVILRLDNNNRQKSTKQILPLF
jgi:hypothetical protein